MAIILFRCPFCGKKVETLEDNVGREGLCPGCEKIFEIPEPSKKGAARAVRPAAGFGLGDGGPPEYGETAVLIGVGAVAVGLAALLATTLLQWFQPWGGAAQVVAAQKGYILVGSAVCLAVLLISAITRKSLMPTVVTGAAWASFSLVWTASLWHALGKAAEGGSSESPAASGVYLAIGACVLVLLGAVFIYYQVHDGTIMEKFGLFLVVTQIVALVGAFLLAGHYLKPALAAPPPAPEQAASQPRRPAPRPPARAPVKPESEAAPAPEGEQPPQAE